MFLYSGRVQDNRAVHHRVIKFAFLLQILSQNEKYRRDMSRQN